MDKIGIATWGNHLALAPGNSGTSPTLYDGAQLRGHFYRQGPRCDSTDRLRHIGDLLMALPNEIKLFCCFLAQRPRRSYATGKPFEDDEPSTRLLARLVDLFQRTWPPGKKPPKSWETATLSVSTETLRVWRSGATQLSVIRMRRFFKDLSKRASTWPASAAKLRHSGGKAGEIDAAREADEAVVRDLLRFVDLVHTSKRLYEARSVLGFKTDTEMQIAVDTYVYRRRPLLEGFWLPHADDTIEALNTEQQVHPLIGHFLVYLQRNDQWWRCPCRVRYLLNLDHDFAFLRFKMEVPAPSTREQSGNSLDGALAINDSHVSWVAEPRTVRQRDLMSFITGRTLQEVPAHDSGWAISPHNVCRATTGKYLTLDQGTNEPVTGNLLLVLYREPAGDALASEADTGLMATVRRLVDREHQEEAAHVQRVFDHLDGHSGSRRQRGAVKKH